MKKSLLLAGACFCSLLIQAQTIEEKDSLVILKNNQQALVFDLKKGLFDIKDGKDNVIIKNAFFQMGGIQSKEDYVDRKYSISETKDELGDGKTLSIRIGVKNYADIIWQATLYGENDYLVFNMGVINDTDNPYKVMAYYPLIANSMYHGIENDLNYKILEGAGGGARTLVLNEQQVTSFNNLFVKFGELKYPKIIVAGGITYNEFEKFVTVKKEKKNLRLHLFAEDPVGKLVDVNQEYIPNEKFYLCFNNTDPFTALEKYGQVLKTAQQIKLNMYDFPTECLWYASFYNNEKGRRKFNDSKGAVEEMENAIKSGITKYTRTAIRLVPDAYGKNNQQGWWDDAHWGMYGDKMSTEGPHYIAPYATTQSWGKAITEKGGIPITYFQSGRRSEDYAQQHPEHMLFNDSYRIINMPERFTHRVNVGNGYDAGYFNHWWADKMLWSYDFTDKDFISHMQNVYKNLKEAGIKGVMYDYPEVTAYAFEGGFEDKYKTTAWAYRNMFRLAYDGLGKDCYLDERNLLRGSDITLGLVASQRVWADTDGITPEMVTRCGLRWYKNRVVVNYDMDSKDPSDALPLQHQDGNRSLLTMCYVTSGRFLLGRSFNQLSEAQLQDMSRVFPYHTSAQSARPLDAFKEGVLYPQVYDFEVTPSWHQLTFYNYNLDMGAPHKNKIEVSLSASLNEGGMALDPQSSYYIYDFWNDKLVGVYKGTDILQQTLREGEARMMSVRKVENHPQYLSTNRHIMQGYLDMKECAWKQEKKTLEGISKVVGADPYKIVIATNGMKYKGCSSSHGKASIKQINNSGEFIELILSNKTNQDIAWKVFFE